MDSGNKNNGEFEKFNSTFHGSRQSGIDAELFDVISAFEALAEPQPKAKRVASHPACNRPEQSTA